MYRILIADPLNPIGLAQLAEKAEVHQLTAEERPRLREMLADFDALVVRSATTVTADLLDAGERLKVVGRAGIGVDNVDVAAATERGILVVNAPTANVLSATEHTFALLLALARKVPQADASMKTGTWDRKSFIGVELQTKTLGVIGFGRIGQRVAARARAFDMKVLAYDPFLDEAVARREEAEPSSLDDLLRRADIITLHTPLTEQTRGLLNADKLALMKPTALVVNCGRGGVVDEAALLDALNHDKLAGAALDVYEQEPPVSFELMQHPKVVATPHIGAQTREAQERIATDTAAMVLAALDGSLNITAVNLPFRSAGAKGQPFLHLGERLGILAGSLLDGSLQGVKVDYWGVEPEVRNPAAIAVLKGVLTPIAGDTVNYVNAERIAAGRCVGFSHTAHHQPSPPYANLMQVTVEGADGSVVLAGTVFNDHDARVVKFRGFALEFRPEGVLLLLRNRDVPGVIGDFGKCIGDAGINIGDIHLARQPGTGQGQGKSQGGDAESSESEAVSVLRIDRDASRELLDALRAMPNILDVRVVSLQHLPR